MRARFLQPWGGSKSEPGGEPGDVVDLDEATFKFLLQRRAVEPAPDAKLTAPVTVPEVESVSDYVEKPSIPKVKVVKATGSKTL